DRFAAPNELCPASTEVSPAADCQIAWQTFARAVPSLHRQHTEPIADTHASQLEWLRQRRRRRALQIRVEIERDSKSSKMAAERLNRFQAGNTPVRQRFRHDRAGPVGKNVGKDVGKNRALRGA